MKPEIRYPTMLKYEVKEVEASKDESGVSFTASLVTAMNGGNAKAVSCHFKPHGATVRQKAKRSQ